MYRPKNMVLRIGLMRGSLKNERETPSVKEKMEALKMDNFSRLFNPFLRLIGWRACTVSFDGCLDTSVKILHVLLLGIVRYLVHDFVGKFNESHQAELEGRLESGEYIAQVNSVWKHSASFFAHVTKFKGSKMNTFYMMREFVKTNKACSIMVQDIMATLNLQHNCHDGECLIEKTKVTEVERQDTDVEEYWRLTRLSYNQPTEEDIVTAMTGGHLAWKGHCQKTMPCKKKKVGKRMVHMTSDTEWGSSGEIS
ncbi:hypothetical protein MJO28_013221 [Puccinia striiformis f. sp. tritici]|uniref:Uncharacterized protein n=1 Tax=Puccinia striiformis f. sp. tritici TaxID=168172 RepID=A0ACC0DY57_9BASI|nr:hypothetical protein MJO28_013221 [Puccinia striiformis f. sp. tritici]